jgi:hypothetical protein
MSADAARTRACATSKWNGYYLTDAESRDYPWPLVEVIVFASSESDSV